MLLGWLDARRATEIGISLADQFASGTAAIQGPEIRSGRHTAPSKRADSLRDFLKRAEREVRAVRLNFYKKAKLANAFKWRLLEKGVASNTAAEVTQTLVMHLSMNRLTAATGNQVAAAPPERRPARSSAAQQLAHANQCIARGAYAEAVDAFEAVLTLKPNQARVMNDLGAAYWKLGRFPEAEQQFRHAIRVQPKEADAHGNLGTLLRTRGELAAAENALRRALKLRPQHFEARSSLGWALIEMGRLPEARQQFDKAVKLAPRHPGGLLGLAKIARSEGRFADAEVLLQQILASIPEQPNAWAALVELRKMTRADSRWLQRAEAIVAGAVTPFEEVDLRFAIGKYCDDVGDFPRAFASYRRANDLLKARVPPYDREARTRFVEDLTRSHDSERLVADAAAPAEAERASMKPVFVVGMPRSGTSLVEQIIASHPEARGAGELRFWAALAQRHAEALRQEPLAAPLRLPTAREYLAELERHGDTALRIVDKAPINADYLGIIHTVFPNARIIYLKRDSVDTCLSCYFQQFSTAVGYSMDLADLAHYYRTHERLVAHWHAVLPRKTILEVSYADLISDQEGWTRRILDFIELKWDARCLNFENTSRTVATASAWQVRQKIYKSSVERWRNYEQFLGPLLELRDERR